MPEGIPEQQLQAPIAASDQLLDIPGVESVSAGTAIGSERSMVDDSFSLALKVTLKSAEFMDVYLKHSAHIAYVDEHIKGIATKIVIYDF